MGGGPRPGMNTWERSSDLLDSLWQDGLLSQDDAALIQDTRATFGGSLLRVLERAAPNVTSLWSRLAAQNARPFLKTFSDIETLEEACLQPYQAPRPLLPRDLAVQTLTLAQRREGETLCLLSPDPFVILTHLDLRNRADEVSPTSRSALRCAVILPAMYRTLMTLTYPSALAGELSFLDRLAVQALVPRSELASYDGREQRLTEQLLVSEDDYALCLSQHLGLPLFDHRESQPLAASVPEHLLHEHGLYPHHLNDTCTLVLLSAQAVSRELNTKLQRLSGHDVTYHITTPTVIRSLLMKRSPGHAHH